MDSALIQYKAYRLFKRLTLGSVCGGPLGANVCRSLEEGMGSPKVSAYVTEIWPVSGASIQRYPFPDSFPPEFPRDAAFDAKCVWRLRDVIAAPDSGLVRIPNGPILQQSTGSLPRLFNKRIADALRRPVDGRVPGPVVLLPNDEFYHVLVEHLPNVLLTRQFLPSAKILLSHRRHPFVDKLLDFAEIPSEDRMPLDAPVRVDDLVFAPLWVNSGFVPACDLDIVRKAILPRIPSTSNTLERIYVSRSRSRNRPLGREKELERALAERGFTICFFETMTPSEQFAAVHHARLIVAPHGAGLANLVAAKPGLRVLELLSRNWFNTCYAKLAVQIGCDYRYLETIPHGAGFDVPVEAVLEEISRP